MNSYFIAIQVQQNVIVWSFHCFQHTFLSTRFESLWIPYCVFVFWISLTTMGWLCTRPKNLTSRYWQWALYGVFKILTFFIFVWFRFLHLLESNLLTFSKYGFTFTWTIFYTKKYFNLKWHLYPNLNNSLPQSLSHLLSTISNIVISEEIGREIHIAVEDFQVERLKHQTAKHRKTGLESKFSESLNKEPVNNSNWSRHIFTI